MFKGINDIRRANTASIALKNFARDDGKIDRARFADALEVSPAFLGRILKTDVAQPRDIGDPLARKIEAVAGLPLHWLDQDHERLPPEGDALLQRYRASTPDIQALVRLAVEDPTVPVPEAIRPSLRALIEAVRLTVAQHLPR